MSEKGRLLLIIRNYCYDYRQIDIYCYSFSVRLHKSRNILLVCYFLILHFARIIKGLVNYRAAKDELSSIIFDENEDYSLYFYEQRYRMNFADKIGIDYYWPVGKEYY